MNLIVQAIYQFNQTVLGIAPREPALMPANECQITIESLKEELDEFIEAQNEGDIVKMVDALCDCMYFAIGALYKNGNTEAQSLLMICGKFTDKSKFLERYYYETQSEDLDAVFIPTDEHRDQIYAAISKHVDNFEHWASHNNSGASNTELSQVVRQCVAGLYSFGVKSNQVHDIMLAINNANMAKKKGVNAKRGDGVAADAVKPEGWIPPEDSIKQILKLDCPA